MGGLHGAGDGLSDPRGSVPARDFLQPCDNPGNLITCAVCLRAAELRCCRRALLWEGIRSQAVAFSRACVCDRNWSCKSLTFTGAGVATALL